jgi:hypothetical protein
MPARRMRNCVSGMSNVRRDISRTFSLVRRVAAQVGSHPLKGPLFAMLLERTDLPDGDWKVDYERAFETGAGTSSTDEIRRAREEESITVVRRLKSDATNRTIVLHLVPFASHEDARLYLPKSVERMLRKPFSRAVVTQEGFVELHELSAIPDVMAYEIQRSGPNGEGGERLIVRVIDELLLTMDFVAAGDLWSWDEVLSIASFQTHKIQTALASRQAF